MDGQTERRTEFPVALLAGRLAGWLIHSRTTTRQRQRQRAREKQAVAALHGVETENSLKEGEKTKQAML